MGVPLMSITCRPVVIGAASAGGQPSKPQRNAATENHRVFVIALSYGCMPQARARRSQNRHDPGLKDPRQPTMEYRMAKLTLYHAAPSRSSITRWMLEEVGEPYDIHLSFPKIPSGLGFAS